MKSSILATLAAASADRGSHFFLHQYTKNNAHRLLPIHHNKEIQARNNISLARTNFSVLTQVALIGRGGGGGPIEDDAEDDNGPRKVGIDPTESNIHSADVSDLRGGANNNNKDICNGVQAKEFSVPGVALSISPQALATLSMATCMSLHYLGYSLARPVTMTMFTSNRLGFGSSAVSAYPFAMTFISPVSFLLLLFYGGCLNRSGPYLALKQTTLSCAGVLGLSSLLLARLDPLLDTHPHLSTLTKYIVGVLFVFRESYVQLITSQHWSFISSVLTPSQSSMWFAPISGLTSVTSALAAICVGKLSALWGIPGVVGAAGLFLAFSVIFGDIAYRVAEKHGFNPADEHYRKKEAKLKAAASKGGSNKNTASTSSSSSPPSKHDKEESLIVKAKDVFTRVPTLWALFCEILACQGLSTVLNVCCVTKVAEVIPDDAERADWMGKFFAFTNVVSSVLQFGVLPATSSFLEPSTLWKIMPLIMMTMSCVLAFPKRVGKELADPTLNMVGAAYAVMKILEFSVRRMLDEMVYVPLDYESRFVGKEVISVLGYRFGKSASSLVLSAITHTLGIGGLRELSYFTTAAAALWLGTAWRLSNFVPTRAEAEEAYKTMKKGS